MRALSQDRIDQLEQRVLSPFYLIEITLDKPYRLTTGERFLYDDQEWEPGLIRNVRLDQEGCEFQLWNENFKHTMAALRGDYLRRPVSLFLAPPPVYELYGDSDGEFYTADAEHIGLYGEFVGEADLLMTGYIASISPIEEWLTIRCLRQSLGMFPRIRAVPPRVNWTRPEGTRVIVRQQRYIIRREPR